MVGDSDQGLELAYLHISTIQMRTICVMLLCDKNPNGILNTSLLTSIPPN
jgi:hypothetical protein